MLNEPNDSSLTGTDTGWFAYSATEQTLCSTTEADWFSRYMFTGETMLVDLTFVDSDGDVEVEIYGPPGPVWLAGAYSGSDNETLSYSIPQDGTYYIHVYMYSDDIFAGQVYDISVSN